MKKILSMALIYASVYCSVDNDSNLSENNSSDVYSVSDSECGESVQDDDNFSNVDSNSLQLAEMKMGSYDLGTISFVKVSAYRLNNHTNMSQELLTKIHDEMGKYKCAKERGEVYPFELFLYPHEIDERNKVSADTYAFVENDELTLLKKNK